METKKEQVVNLNQETSINENSIKFKIYNYFYLILKSKNEINSIILVLLIVLETIQLISYAFSDPHLDSWKIDKQVIDIISIIFGSTRVSPLMKYLSFNTYLTVIYCLLGLIFMLYIILIFQILTSSATSNKISGIPFARIAINIVSILLYTPMTELFLLPLKCKDGKIAIISNSEECGSGFYYIYMTIGIIGTILLFLLVLFFLNFYFYPFFESSFNKKLNNSNDIFLHITKLIFILRYIFITNEYVSIVILLTFSLFCSIKESYDKTYSNNLLQTVVNIRNVSTLWTYFILLVSKICYNSKINGIMYLLYFSYPIIIYLSILKVKRENLDYFLFTEGMNDINYLLKQTKILINMIESEIEENNALKKIML